MNISRIDALYMMRPVLCLMIVWLGASCASTDQQQESLDNYDDNYNYDNNANANGNSENSAENGDNNSNYGDSEGYNNDEYNEFEDEQQLALQEDDNGYEDDLGLNDEYSQYAEGNDEYGEYTNNAEESDELLADNSGLNLTNDTLNTYADDAAPVNAAADTPMMDAPVEAAAPMPSGGGIVKYIRESTSYLNSPEGSAVGTASIGDHPVVWDEGNFHRDAKGRYIPSSALSESGVGRPRDGGMWRSSGGGY